MLIVTLLLTYLSSPESLAQSFTPGDSRTIKFGNGDDGYYSGSFLNPVGQGGAGSNPKEVKTDKAFFGSYTGKTAYEKGTEAKNRDEASLNSKYQTQIYSLFAKEYFPNKAWDGTTLVEKVYSIIEGVRGDQKVAQSNAAKHRTLTPTNLNDIAQWSSYTSEADLKKAYKEKYRTLMGFEPTGAQVNEFYNIFNAIKNAIPWSGLCNQFSAANANPYFNQAFTDLYERDGEVFLCQKPITLGEIKEGTTLMYDAVAFDYPRMGGENLFRPSGDLSENIFMTDKMDFLKDPAFLSAHPVGTFIEGKDLEPYRKKYSSFVYQNYYERLGKSPTGMDFCALDKRVHQLESQDYGDATTNAVKNKVPIMNLDSGGETWNAAVVGAQRDVKMFNVYNGKTMTSTGVQASNSFGELIQLYAKKKLEKNIHSEEFKLYNKLLLRYSDVMCKFVTDNNMTKSKMFCDQLLESKAVNVTNWQGVKSTFVTPPVPAGENMDQWSAFPKELVKQNQKADDALAGLALSFIVFSEGNARIDGKGLPQLGSSYEQFNNFKLQNVSLSLDFIKHTSFADESKTASTDKVSYDGLVLVDENQSPAKQVGCSWKNVWNYNSKLKVFESKMPSSFMTLDIPACPADTKAKKLLDKVKQCATFKDFLKKYNQWMLEASQGFNPDKISDDIDAYKTKYPETNINWTLLKQQILDDMHSSFTSESDL